MKIWESSRVDELVNKHLGVIEFQDATGEWHDFEVIHVAGKLVFGGACNVGFLESGYMEIDNCFSIDENLQDLIQELEVYYSDGKEFCDKIVCNDRM